MREQIMMAEETAKNELEIANEAMIMTYLNFLKYAEHHCNPDQDPTEVTNYVFYVWYKVASEINAMDDQAQ